MAQLMRYWRWPEHGYGSVTYDDELCGQTLSTDLSAHTYDWSHMLSTYVNDGFNYSEQQTTAVATLMRDCGYAVHTAYSPTESGAILSPQVLQDNFHYSPTAKVRSAYDYSQQQWEDYILHDLRAGRPVIYSASRPSAGHMFIIDGLDAYGNFHVNWGWGGQQDGYFMLTDLNGFDFLHAMISHVEPDRNPGSEFDYDLDDDGLLTIYGAGKMPGDYQLAEAPWRDRHDEIRKIVISEGITTIVESFGAAVIDGQLATFSNLEEVVLPEGLLVIGPDAFMRADKLTGIQLPSSLVCMDYAFFDSQGLRSLHLPASLEEFSDELPHLASITVDEQNPLLAAHSDVLYSKDGKALLFAPRGLDHIAVEPTVETVLDPLMLSRNGVSVLFQSMSAPELPRFVNLAERGYLYLPYGSTGYEGLAESLPEGWRVLPYDIARRPEMQVMWSLRDGLLTLQGHGEQSADLFAADHHKVARLVAREGITGFCPSAFTGYDRLTELELPSTFAYIGDLGLASTALSAITCHAMRAPLLGQDVFLGVPTGGTLRVPEGSDYASWLEALPDGWTVETFPPEPFATAYLYTGEVVSIDELADWEQLLASFPNAIGIVNPRYGEWAYAAHNLLFEDEAGGGYRCPSLRLTDLTFGFATSAQAPWTGFVAPVAFSIDEGEYKRRLTEGYNTVCLPFSVDGGSLPRGCRMYVFSLYDAEQDAAVFAPKSSCEAGEAFILTCNNAGVEWQTDLSGLTVAAGAPSKLDGNMRGTYVSTADYQGIGFSPRAKDNVFAPLAQWLHPFRACFLPDVPTLPAELHIRLGDEADGISATTGAQDTARSIYNIAGQRLSKPQKGVNIIDGKTVIR